MSFKKGDKVKFNEKTVERFNFWLNDKYHCGRHSFCNDIKKFDFENCSFTVAEAYSCGRVGLKELPLWYFSEKEFIEVTE